MPDAPPDASSAVPAPRIVFRHRLSTRLWHWINTVAIFVMLMSGLTISNAHRRLYWGEYGAEQRCGLAGSAALSGLGDDPFHL
jgi:hypothetical protein